MQKKTKSGVLVYNNFRDNLIIDKYDQVFQNMRDKKIEQISSENSEDALTWNVFRSLKQLDPQQWLPILFQISFSKDYPYSTTDINIKLWERLKPPSILREGNTEVDILIESNDFVWIIEAKYISDIELNTTYGENRDQIIRNIDVGSFNHKNKDFYFSLLYLSEEHTPKGYQKLREYQDSFEQKQLQIPHLTDLNDYLIGIGSLTWFDLTSIFSRLKVEAESEFERYIADRAEKWLKSKGIIKKAGNNMLYNVTWLTSQTKQIYNATKKSEKLMEYLEDSLVNKKLVELIGEHPVPEAGREYGVLIYYYKAKPKRRLLSAAPRRVNNYIHVVLFQGILNKEELARYNFEIGNSRDPLVDVKIYQENEIDTLTDLLKNKIHTI